MIDNDAYQSVDDTFRGRAQMFVENVAAGVEAAGLPEMAPPALCDCRFHPAGDALRGEADLLIAPGFVLTVEARLTGDDAMAATIAKATARVIVTAARERAQIARRVAAVADRVRALAARARDESFAITIVDVRLAPVWLGVEEPTFEVAITVDETGDMLRPVRSVYTVSTPAELNALVAAQVGSARLRADRLHVVRALGGVGFVDAVTLRAIDATSEGRALLRQAAWREEPRRDAGRVEPGDLEALRWSEGVLRGCFDGGNAWFAFGAVTLREGRVDVADIGRPVHDLAAHPAFGDAVVGEIFDAQKGCFWVPAALHVFNAAGEVLT
jgi:hypothetical protein